MDNIKDIISRDKRFFKRADLTKQDIITILKEALETQYQYRIDNNTQELIDRFKRQYRAGSENLVLSVGDSLEKVKETLANPDKTQSLLHSSLCLMKKYV